MPVISVLLPAYNAERFVRAAIRSVLDQTFGDFELIVVDDGSTDGTGPILRELAAADARLRVVSRPNTGYVVALNEAIGLARGEFLARMDADDLSLPTRFGRQVAYLRSHGDCVLLGTHVAQMDGDGTVIGPMPDVSFGHDAIDRDLLRGGWPIVHPAVMMRAWAVRHVGGYLPDLCPNEDHDLFLKLSELGPVDNLPDVLLHYRKHAGSESAVKQGRTAELKRRIILAACRRRGIPVPAEVAQPGPVAHQSPAQTRRAWAWHAVKHGNVAAARKYAWATLRHAPMSPDSWRLAYCAARGR